MTSQFSGANASDDGGATERQLVVFALGTETFGIDIESVREIIRWQPVTAVPDAPPAVIGVLNLRGSVTPVVDLRSRFNLAATEPTDETRVLVIDSGTSIGVVVDSVTEVVRLPMRDIDTVIADTVRVDSDYIDGIAQWGDSLLILLDMRKALLEQGLGETVAA